MNPSQNTKRHYLFAHLKVQVLGGAAGLALLFLGMWMRANPLPDFIMRFYFLAPLDGLRSVLGIILIGIGGLFTFWGVIGILASPIAAARDKKRADEVIAQGAAYAQAEARQAIERKNEARAQEARAREERQRKAVRELSRRNPTTDPARFTTAAVEAEMEALLDAEHESIARQYQQRESEQAAVAATNMHLLQQAMTQRRRVHIAENGLGGRRVTGTVQSLDTSWVTIKTGDPGEESFDLGNVHVKLY